MRHTLLPLNERKTLRRDYFTRLLIVLCFLISFAFIIGIIGQFPAFIHAKSLEKAELNSAAQIQASKDAQNKANIDQTLKQEGILVNKLAGDRVQGISANLDTLIKVRGDISFHSISYAEVGTSSVEMVVQGKAPNRSDLLSFKERIASTFVGAKIDLPISELAKSKDIDFSVKVTIKI